MWNVKQRVEVISTGLLSDGTKFWTRGLIADTILLLSVLYRPASMGGILCWVTRSTLLRVQLAVMETWPQ